jgi:hypothetical protein
VSVTMKQVRAHLDRDEPDYPAAAQLGVDAIPHLVQLVVGSDPMLASKAAYLASLVQDDRSKAVLEQAASNPHVEVRIAAAAGMRNVEQSPTALADILLNDGDVGVRKIALRSIEARSLKSATVGPQSMQGLKAKVREAAQSDSDIFIRNLASRIVDAL